MFNRKLRKDIENLQEKNTTAHRIVSELVSTVRELQQKVYLLENPYKFEIGENVEALLGYSQTGVTACKKIYTLIIDRDCIEIYDTYQKYYVILEENKRYKIDENQLSKIIKTQSCNTSTSFTLNSTNQTLTSQENQEKK